MRIKTVACFLLSFVFCKEDFAKRFVSTRVAPGTVLQKPVPGLDRLETSYRLAGNEKLKPISSINKTSSS